MTDNEIIKALDGCVSSNCTECPHNTEDGCTDALIQNAIDLINGQRMEIERLKKEIERLQKAIQVQDIMLDKQDYKLKRAKTEAVKEFADKVNREITEAIISNDKAIAEREKKHKVNRYEDNFCAMCDGKVVALSGLKSFIDNLVKEMVGEG